MDSKMMEMCQSMFKNSDKSEMMEMCQKMMQNMRKEKYENA
ncbi:MAG: hypothetical protein QME14_00550 [Methanobacteriaceae archaeon]|nr:hypothetical protein [Methanobacteriaceae archaeon]